MASPPTVPGYAARLSAYPNKGACGLAERFDSQRTLTRKLDTLASLVRAANGKVVILTGAGISTSAGIPDFRGPNGVWTIEERVRKQKKIEVAKKRTARSTSPPPPAKRVRKTPAKAVAAAASSFASASPTVTHRAIAALVASRLVDFVVTQNVDALHQRTTLPRDKLAVLHGSLFEERCSQCGAIAIVKDEIATISFKPTGRSCAVCGGAMHDTLLDWEDALPEAEFTEAEARCDDAALVIVLGSSLRIEPAGSLPARAAGGAGGEGQYVIVNLQTTPKVSLFFIFAHDCILVYYNSLIIKGL